MAKKFFDLVWMNIISTGSAESVELSPVPMTGYLTAAAAGVTVTDDLSYVIRDGAAWEVGQGTVDGLTLNRSTVIASSNEDDRLELSDRANVVLTAIANDLNTINSRIKAIEDTDYTPILDYANQAETRSGDPDIFKPLRPEQAVDLIDFMTDERMALTADAQEQTSSTLLMGPAQVATAIDARIPMILKNASGSAWVNKTTKAIRTLGHTVPGIGSATYVRVASEPAHEGKLRTNDRYLPNETVDNANGGWWMIAETTITPEMLGALGDGTADDAEAIEYAVDIFALWGCRLVFDEGRDYRMSYSVSKDFGGVNNVGELIMWGSIKPDPGIGAALEFINVRKGLFALHVEGGGQTADYTQADPVGCDEAFRFINTYETVIDHVWGYNYQGRVLRITTDDDLRGPGGFRSQWMHVKEIKTNSTAPVTASEATRMAQGVGQAFFIDTKTNASGVIDHVYSLWELYGPVVENTTDLTMHFVESLWRGNSAMELRGVISFWGGTFNLGSETYVLDNLRIVNSTGPNGRVGYNIHIKQIFTIGGLNGLVLENIGSTAGSTGITIGKVISRLNHGTAPYIAGRGLKMTNVRKFDINIESYDDATAIEMIGNCWSGKVHFTINGCRSRSVIVPAEPNNVLFTGTCENGNRNNDPLVPTVMFDIQSAGNHVEFLGVVAGCDLSSYLWNFAGSSSARIIGGRAVRAGSTQLVNGQPGLADDVVGWTTANQGTATITAGSTFVDVNHGLVRMPDFLFASPRDTNGAGAFCNSAGSTTFRINLPSAAAANAVINWNAKLNYTGRS